MLLYICIQVLVFVTGAVCQNQFNNPPPRQEGDPAVAWHLGSVVKVTWTTTSSKFKLLCRSEATNTKGNSVQDLQLFDPSVDPNCMFPSELLIDSHYQPTSPYGYKIGLPLNASLGAFYFQLVDVNGNSFSSNSFVIIESFGDDFTTSTSSTTSSTLPSSMPGSEMANSTTPAGGSTAITSSITLVSQTTTSTSKRAASSTSTAAAQIASGLPASALVGLAIGVGLAL